MTEHPVVMNAFKENLQVERLVQEKETLYRRQLKLRGVISEALKDLNALEKRVRIHDTTLLGSIIADDIHRISQKLYPSDLIGN